MTPFERTDIPWLITTAIVTLMLIGLVSYWQGARHLQKNGLAKDDAVCLPEKLPD